MEKEDKPGKDRLSEVMRLIPETRGERLPSGAVRLPDGGIVCPPVGTAAGVMDPDPKSGGGFIPFDGRSQLTPSGGGRSAQYPADRRQTTKVPAKRRKRAPEPVQPADETLRVRLDRGVFPSPYRYVLRGRGVLVLGMGPGSFRPDEPGDDPTEIEFADIGVWHYFGHRVTDRDGGEALVLLRMGSDDR